MYESYKKARNKSWEVLLEYGVCELPVDLKKIAQCSNIHINFYSTSSFMQLFRQEVVDGDGFILSDDGQKKIYLNDKIHNRNRRRFTLAHELGHGILSHDIAKIHYRNSEMDSQTDLQELEANVFARDLLMPAIVLHHLGAVEPEDIMRVCHVSYQSAVTRSERLRELNKRNKFGYHPNEIKVLEQFKEYIDSYVGGETIREQEQKKKQSENL